MLIRSLRFQVVFVLLLLAATMITQLLLSRSDIQILKNNQYDITESYHNLTRVYELERDVIDLQRNLLIFKESGSDSSIAKFFSIMERVIGQLENLKKLSSKNFDYIKYKKTISRMLEHLNDYQENFVSVIESRNQRSELKLEIERYIEEISILSNEKLPLFSQDLSEIKFHLSAMTRSLYQHLNQPDLEHIATFKTRLTALQITLKKNKSTKLLLPASSIILKRFIKLTNVTRGYIFLINIVMAGSANEFLYLSDKLKSEVEKDKDKLILSTEKSGVRILFINNIEAAVLLFIMLLIAWFLSKRILIPINGITEVFRVLSKGDSVECIPSTDRNDEVGDLAKAAEIFHKNNQLTQDLLERSQDMIANKEVMNIQLEIEKDKAQQAAKTKSMFLANMSHEIRTPMNGIVGLVDLVLKTKLNHKQKNYLDRIAYSGKIMMNVINDILDFSKIEAGKMEIEQVEFDINTVIENLISAINIRINEKKLNFQVVTNNRVPRVLIGDSLRISQILLNLCNNAVKFTECGGLEINIDYQNQFLEFQVKDTGIGMSEKQSESIFHSFTQADGTTSRKYGGTGLGLTIVKQLIELMNGEVSLNSAPGKGTQVYVKIESKYVPSTPDTIELNQQENIITHVSENLNKITQSLLSGFSLNVEQISFKAFTTNINGPILIETSNVEFLQAIWTDIKLLIDTGSKIGFLLKTNDYHNKAFINASGNFAVLQHPFSPGQCKAYLSALYSDDNTEDALLKSQQKNKKDQKFIKYDGHVLLVEDNDINQLVAGDMLESLGLTFDVVNNGRECLDIITDETQYKMIFMDVQMPIMDGYTATQKLRQRGYSELVICGLSANALKEDQDAAEQAGMTDYLTKPLQIESLEKLVKKYVGKNI
ncbi:MAG: signal transduction histidine kinase/CheY-like chemotaxis protein [Francisellaceae bacterium]|jgi:signal transduction histidine kinase/CheY-like chemotaxis protein